MNEGPGTGPGAAGGTLLRAGALAGPLYLLIGGAQALTRDGFDVRRHALSLLSNGELGWIQTANFLLAGALVIAGAAGLRRVMRGTRGGTWAPLLVAVYGIGLVGAGTFAADPGLGFPPGTPESVEMSTSGLLHFVFGALGFYAIIAACFVFARRFGAAGRRGWALYSGITGVLFLISFGAIASGSTASSTILGFYAAVAAMWIWHAAVHVRALRDTNIGAAGTMRAEPVRTSPARS